MIAHIIIGSPNEDTSIVSLIKWQTQNNQVLELVTLLSSLRLSETLFSDKIWT